MTHADYFYALGTSTTVTFLASDFISYADSTNCPLTNCQIIDSTTSAVPSYLTSPTSSSLSYTYNLNLATFQSSNLRLSCNGNSKIISSNNFAFIICGSSVCASGYSFTGTSTPSSY